METIRSSAEITRLFNEGKRVHTPDITLIALRREQHGPGGRAAFIAGKKLGNAVWRNRAKRRMRALCRDVSNLPEGYDVAFLAKRSVNKTPYAKMLNDLDKALEKLSETGGATTERRRPRTRS